MNALVIDGWMSSHVWWRDRITPYFEHVFIVPLYGDKIKHCPVNTVVCDNVRKGRFDINYLEFNHLLEFHEIDIVFQYAQFNRPALKLSEFINSRNFLISQGMFNGRLIDQFFYEQGYLRPCLEQLDPEGWNVWSSISGKEFPVLTESQDAELSKWIADWRITKLAESHGRISRIEIIKRYGIDPHTKLALCVQQRPNDSVLLQFSHWCHSKSEFVETCLELFSNLDYHLIFRPHPRDNTRSLSYDLLMRNAPSNTTFLKQDDISIIDYIEACDSVCVVNSTVGCEALALDKPVITFGYSAYRHNTIAIGSVNYDFNLLKRITEFDLNRPKRRAFLYNFIKTSYGKMGLQLRDSVNIQSRYTYME